MYDAGYDVWMGNARGNRFSKGHVTLDSEKSNKYWQFSWHDIGIHDVPETIDYVLANTNSSALHYIGHSQGTTTFFVMLSEKPEYNEKIISFHAMAPAMFLRESPMSELLIDNLDLLEVNAIHVVLYNR